GCGRRARGRWRWGGRPAGARGGRRARGGGGRRRGRRRSWGAWGRGGAFGGASVEARLAGSPVCLGAASTQVDPAGLQPPTDDLDGRRATRRDQLCSAGVPSGRGLGEGPRDGVHQGGTMRVVGGALDESDPGELQGVEGRLDV